MDSLVIESEAWGNFFPDFRRLCVRHWEEIALNKDIIPLDPDWHRYEAMANDGILECISARKNGELIGYQIFIVVPHLHYKSSITAHSDVLYLVPEARKGMLGVRLMKKGCEVLQKRGVQKVVQNVKLHSDWGRILERMGFDPIERIYSKVFGG